jgi:tetratricopeptide (TPR) repeat protein
MFLGCNRGARIRLYGPIIWLYVLLITFCGAAPLVAADSPVLHIQQLIQAGDLDAAKAELRAALASSPRDAALYNLQGIVNAQSHDYSGAESSFKTAIRLDPALIPAYMNLGRLYQEGASADPNAVHKGIAIYIAVLERQPSHREALYQAASLLQTDGQYRRSLTLLERLPPAEQSRPQVLAIKCADEIGLGRTVDANRALKLLLDSPDAVEADITTVQQASAAHKRPALELAALTKLVAMYSASYAQLLRLAVIYEGLGRLPEARTTLESAARLGPVSVPLLLGLAQVAYKQQDRAGALGYLAHAREIDPKNGAIHFFFGIVCVEMDLPIEAEKSLAAAVQADPENAYYNYAMGAVTIQSRKWAEAIPYFEKYARLKPADPRGKLAIGIAHFYAHEEDVARKELEEVRDRPETSATAHLYLGKIATRENDLIRAEGELKRCLELNSTNAEAWAELGFVLVEAERYADAEKALTRSLHSNPDNLRANLALLALYQRTGDNRAEAQAARVEAAKKKRTEESNVLLRTLEIRPY